MIATNLQETDGNSSTRNGTQVIPEITNHSLHTTLHIYIIYNLYILGIIYLQHYFNVISKPSLPLDFDQQNLDAGKALERGYHPHMHTLTCTHTPIHTHAHTHTCIYLIVNLVVIYNTLVHIEVNACTHIRRYCGDVTAGHWDNTQSPENLIILP